MDGAAANRFSIVEDNVGVSERIKSSHFGSAFENRGQTVDGRTPFAGLAKRLDLPAIRYPGGTQTENNFDPSNPDNSRPSNIFSNVGGSAKFVPLSEFLNYCAENGVAPIIVLPTWRYFDENTRKIDPGAESTIKHFVSEVRAGAYGEISIKAFEIGNEWFNDHFKWTPAEFAELQKTMAIWVDEAIREAGTADTDVWIQSNQEGQQDHDSNGIPDNVEFRQAFDSKEIAVVDGIVDHFYQPTRGANALSDEYFNEEWVPQLRAERLASDGWNIYGKNAIELVATEWNVRADRGDNGPMITGLERSPMFLRLFAEMLQSGVDYANVFTVQGLGASNGVLSRKGESTLTPTGLLFELLRNSLVGTRLVDQNSDGLLERDEFVFEDENGRESGYMYTYEGANKKIMYFSSAVGRSVDLEIDYKDLFREGYQVHAALLSSTSSNPLDPAADAQVSEIPFSRLDGSKRGDGQLEIKLGKYETLQIEFVVDQGFRVEISDECRTDNRIEGTPWADRLIGGMGTDTILAGSGDDTLRGGGGKDVLLGGGGSDRYYVGTGDRVKEYRANGHDTIYTSSDYVLPSNVEDLVLTGGMPIIGSGNKLNNTLTSNGAGAVLKGGLGDDTLCGGKGNDQFIGGGGFDMVVFEGAGPVHVDLSSAGWQQTGRGRDQFKYIESVSGGGGKDVLIGTSGTNTLIGHGGQDTLIGRSGNDTYYVDQRDKLVELKGEGRDTAVTPDDFRLPNNIERLIGFGVKNINLFGNEENNYIVGNSGNNKLTGAGGNDTLVGGRGNDAYLIVDKYDEIREAGAQGIDTARSTVSFVLPRNVERLILGGESDLIATGNSEGNYIQGNNGDNTIKGAGGRDTLVSSGGNDTIYGGSGIDSIKFLTDEAVELDLGTRCAAFGDSKYRIEGVENAYGGNNNDRITGDHRANILDGGMGDDTLIGQRGDDTYFIDAGDVVREGRSQGHDTLITRGSVDLWANVESVRLIGANDSSVQGNDMDNRIVGNSGNNILLGRSGADRIGGGKGRDFIDCGKDDLDKDTIVFWNVEDSPSRVKNGADEVSNFESNYDIIDLTKIDANLERNGNQKFTWSHEPAGNCVWLGTDRLGRTVVSADVDGDAVSEFRLIIRADEITLDNFLL